MTNTVTRIKSEKDFFAGLLFMAVGIGFAWGATNYKIGDAARMGPGYFPLMLGVLLAIVGLVVVFLSMVVETEDGDPVGRIAWRPVCFIILANLVFGALLGGLPSVGLPHMGLMAAIFALTFIAALAGDEFRFKEVLILAIVLAVLSYVAFIWLLSLQFPAWPAFISG
ncbi:MAG: tripartite tricarboxylate transporter TctB family protein [Burkholderiaceae bacterium]